jgi:hypothetical protein
MADLLMQTCMLAAEEGFESGQREWAAGVRKLSDSKAKKDAVLAFLRNFPSDSHTVFLNATMLILKGSGTPGAANWMQNIDNGVNVTVDDLVKELI